MDRVRRLLALIIVGAALAACQQGGSGARKVPTEAEASAAASPQATTGTGENSDYVATKAFKAKRNELTLKLAEKLIIQCSAATSTKAMNACFHERTLAGFDSDGTAKSHCPQQDNVEADMNCIVLGGIGYRLAGKVGKDAVAAFDWADPQKSTRDVTNQIVLQQIRNCLTNGSASDPQKCVMSGITKFLDLSDSDLDPCSQLSDDDFEFSRCVGEAFSYKYLAAGIARM